MELKTCIPCDDYSAPFVTQVNCCMCGISIEANSSNMCINCLRANVDISEGLQKEYIVIYCPECERYLQPPKYWSKAAFESRELMVICLKKIKGLSKYNLADASFVWTEEHSKRLKLKLQLQKEVFTKTIIQQTVLIDYTINWQQCDRCARAATGQPQWAAVVQLRQRVDHKRTFLYLEQLILKHRMHEDAIKIESHPSGLDFFFGHKSHAHSFMSFIFQCVPSKRTDAVELVSHDSKSNTAIEHHTFSVEIAPICREDLVCLPPKLRQQLGGTGPLVIVHKVFSSIVFMDPRTLKASEIMGTRYWTHPFEALANTKQLSDFYVLDVEKEREYNAKYQLARVTICPANNIGGGDEYQVTTHLGRLLKPGDYVKGYFLRNINHNNEHFDKYDHSTMEDVVLVRKHFPHQKRRRNRRTWKVKHLDVIEDGVGNQKAGARFRNEDDEEEFLDDIERDREFREDFALYKTTFEEDLKKKKEMEARAAAAGGGIKLADDDEEEEGDDDEEAQVELAELLDELKLDDGDDEGRAADGGDGEGDELAENQNEDQQLRSMQEQNPGMSRGEAYQKAEVPKAGRKRVR